MMKQLILIVPTAPLLAVAPVDGRGPSSDAWRVQIAPLRQWAADVDGTEIARRVRFLFGLGLKASAVS